MEMPDFIQRVVAADLIISALILAFYALLLFTFFSIHRGVWQIVSEQRKHSKMLAERTGKYLDESDQKEPIFFSSGWFEKFLPSLGTFRNQGFALGNWIIALVIILAILFAMLTG